MYRTLIILLITAMRVSCTPPNFIFVLTDDQDLLLNGLLPMNETLKLIANHGMIFENSFVNSPICCPSRSTILTGLYAHNSGVTNNSLNGNCSSKEWQRNFEPNSIASLLKSRNYTNFYAGKYLNQYGSKQAGGTAHIPDGYDWWLGLDGNSAYYNYTLSINGTSKFFEDYYLTDNIADNVLEFLKQNFVTTKPFFVMLAPPAPHSPFIPAPRHNKEFPNAKTLRNPAFNYSSNDKHWLVRMPPKHLPTNIGYLDQMARLRLQTLLAVDEMIKKVIERLDEIKILNNTYIIFTSDNGFHIGQFTQPWDKRQLYETDIRVPFMIRGPKIPSKFVTQFPIASVDIAPTILDLAGFSGGEFDGKSFKKQLFSRNKDLDEVKNQFVLIEYWGESNPKSVESICGFSPIDNVAECTKENWCKCQDSRNNTYECVVHFSNNQTKFKFCQFHDHSNFVEAYNLHQDPYELTNIYKYMKKSEVKYYRRVLNQLKSCKGRNCKEIK